jgi:hypothetical protein
MWKGSAFCQSDWDVTKFANMMALQLRLSSKFSFPTVCLQTKEQNVYFISIKFIKYISEFVIRTGHILYITMIFLITLQPLWALTTFQSPDLFTIGRTPWTSEQLVTRPQPNHRTP